MHSLRRTPLSVGLDVGVAPLSPAFPLALPSPASRAPLRPDVVERSVGGPNAFLDLVFGHHERRRAEEDAETRAFRIRVPPGWCSRPARVEHVRRTFQCWKAN